MHKNELNSLINTKIITALQPLRHRVYYGAFTKLEPKIIWTEDGHYRFNTLITIFLPRLYSKKDGIDISRKNFREGSSTNGINDSRGIRIVNNE